MKTERLIVKYQSRTVVNGKYFTTRRFDISPDGERTHRGGQWRACHFCQFHVTSRL